AVLNGSEPVTNAVALSAAVEALKSAIPANARMVLTDHNIRFQFDSIPYAEVLTRFAQMVNKPLVSDTKVDGTLSFNDPQPYTYAEALEMLNLVLSMKGVMLVEADRYLRLVPLKDLQQM